MIDLGVAVGAEDSLPEPGQHDRLVLGAAPRLAQEAVQHGRGRLELDILAHVDGALLTRDHDGNVRRDALDRADLDPLGRRRRHAAHVRAGRLRRLSETFGRHEQHLRGRAPIRVPVERDQRRARSFRGGRASTAGHLKRAARIAALYVARTTLVTPS